MKVKKFHDAEYKVISVDFDDHRIIRDGKEVVVPMLAQAYITQETDTSTLETSDKQERILRRSFGVRLEAYIPNPKFLVTSTGEIEEFKGEATIY